MRRTLRSGRCRVAQRPRSGRRRRRLPTGQARVGHGCVRTASSSVHSCCAPAPIRDWSRRPRLMCSSFHVLVRATVMRPARSTGACSAVCAVDRVSSTGFGHRVEVLAVQGDRWEQHGQGQSAIGLFTGGWECRRVDSLDSGVQVRQSEVADDGHHVIGDCWHILLGLNGPPLLLPRSHELTDVHVPPRPDGVDHGRARPGRQPPMACSRLVPPGPVVEGQIRGAVAW